MPSSTARRRRGIEPSTSTSDPATPAPEPTTPTLTPSYFSLYPSTPLAVAARNGSPLVFLAFLALCFRGLVESSSGTANSSRSPVSGDASAAGDATAHAATDTAVLTLAGLLALVTVVQAAASVVGLPPAGSQEAEVRRRRAKKDVRKPNVIVTTTLSLVLTALSVPLVHIVLVLFGAPFLTQTARTLLCAAHLAVLGLFPVIYTCGTDGTGAWRAVASGRLQALDAAVGGLWGACAGAWLGAVPIPLDWDRPWQQWPVTVLVGIYVGHAVGRLVGGALQRR